MKDKVINETQAKKLIRDFPTVLVSGSFDLIHLGHLRFLHQAKAIVGETGRLLVVLLDDKAIKSRKGNSRPIFNNQERLEFLSYNQDVDSLLLWEKPWEKLRDFVLETKPHFLAVVDKDQGLANKASVINQAGGKLVLFSEQGLYSSTWLLNKIKKILKDEKYS